MKELLLINYDDFFIQITANKKIGIGLTIGNDGLQIVFLFFFIGLITRKNIF